jgi:hypothetical protein
MESGKTHLQNTAKSASSVAYTRCSSSIWCHHCHGLGHVQKDCPSKRAYIATKDGGYVSTSDVEEDIVDEPASDDDHDQDDLSLSLDNTGTH